MSALPLSTLLIVIALLMVIGPGLLVLALDHLSDQLRGTETYHLSTRELPNIAADVGAPDRNSARR